MSDPKILLVSDNPCLASAVVRHCGSLSGLGAVQIHDPGAAAEALCHGDGDGTFLLCVVDLALPEEAVRRLAAASAANGVPWLAVAGRYRPEYRNLSQELDAIDFVVAEAEDPASVAR